MRGNGFTNHCSECLWSKHVDIDPGDREETCGGLMKPIGVSERGGGYVITHRCVSCRVEKVNKADSGDNFEALIALC